MLPFTSLLLATNNCFRERISAGSGKGVLSYKRISDALELDSGRYIDAAAEDGRVMPLLSQEGLMDDLLSKPAVAAYANPQRILPLWTKFPPPDDKGLGFPPDAHIRLSAAILVTEFNLPFGRQALGAVIRTDVSEMKHYRDAMVFGIFGTYGAGCQDMSVKTLLVPRIDQHGCMAGLREADTGCHAEIESALEYIKLCKNQVFDGGPLYARDIWRKLLERRSPPSAALHIS